MSISLSVEFPLDDDGYVMRECPKCSREFKWHHGDLEGKPADAEDPEEYACPLCGQRSEPSDFLTEDQAGLVEGTAFKWMSGNITEMLGNAVGSSKNFRFEAGDKVPAPRAIQDGADTVSFGIVEPPCHPWEPVKVHDSEPGPFFCIVCARQYAV